MSLFCLNLVRSLFRPAISRLVVIHKNQWGLSYRMTSSVLIFTFHVWKRAAQTFLKTSPFVFHRHELELMMTELEYPFKLNFECHIKKITLQFDKRNLWMSLLTHRSKLPFERICGSPETQIETDHCLYQKQHAAAVC